MEPIKLNDYDRGIIADAVRFYDEHAHLRGHDHHLIKLARRVLAEQEERDGPEKPTIAEIVKELKTTHASCNHSEPGDLFRVAAQILAAVEEFMRDFDPRGLQAMAALSLHKALSRLLR